MGFPPFRRSQKPEIQQIQRGRKWLPEKERTLQNRQILGFCGVPSMSAVAEAAQQPERKIKDFGNGLDFLKSTILLPLWGSLHFDRKPKKFKVPSDIVGCDI